MKIKLFILGLVFACLGLTSFSSAFETVSVNLYGDTNNRVGKPSEISSLPFAICGDKGITIYFCMATAGSCSEYTFNPPSGVSSWAGLSSCIYVNNNSALNYWKYFYASQDTTVNFYQLSPCSSSSCDYSQYESTISTLSGNLASCQSDLANCENTPSLSGDLATCQGSLGACLEENTSIENMNSSLQDQLSQCLANSNACDPTEDEDCYTGAYQLFHLFRQNQGSDFSLPITNNIFLPSGLRAFNDSGSVALAPLSPSDYSLDRESGEILNDLVIKIFYYLAVLLSVMALAYYIKKFLSFTLFPKKD